MSPTPCNGAPSDENPRNAAQDLTTTKYLFTSVIALTLYDYLLSFDDEVRYVWRGRKSWVSSFYIVNRVLLIGYQIVCLVGYYVQMVLIAFFLLFSDVFVTLRLYAITSKNKTLALYFGTLASARLTIFVVSFFVGTTLVVDLPVVPIDTFNTCAIYVNPQLMFAPTSIGTVFDLSAFLVIVRYTYRNKRALKFSALIRAIVADASIYFLAMVAMQIYVQLSVGLTKGIDQQRPFLVYGIITPVLAMRFAVSLKRSADPKGGQEWQLSHFTSIDFGGRVSTVRENVEMGHVDPPNDQRTSWH